MIQNILEVRNSLKSFLKFVHRNIENLKKPFTSNYNRLRMIFKRFFG